ncbi:BlaI/MecI/CopY family transcriptional regulator [Woeseia oceani]|uniref:BlaI/MecI/CopY family transcriptional regulator n=1 Tax=Woeseia oceani TaxID=1548547 RepID=UPI0012EAA6C7|nr:BlaI/MecI/CopY family transcriptional regulator [Woeseia oceani]
MIDKIPGLMRGFELRKSQRLPDLGERELLVLEVLWKGGDASAKRVRQQMPDNEISLSTVQSTLERLHRKGLVDRDKDGRAYRYRATLDKSQFIGHLMRDMAQSVTAGEMAPMISGFLRYVTDEGPEMLQDLSTSLESMTAGDKGADDHD